MDGRARGALRLHRAIGEEAVVCLRLVVRLGMGFRGRAVADAEFVAAADEAAGEGEFNSRAF